MPQSRTAVPDRRNAQKPRTRHARGASQADLSPAARVYTAVAVAVCPPSSPSDSGWAGGRCIAPPYPTSPEVQPPNRDEVARAGGLRLLDTPSHAVMKAAFLPANFGAPTPSPPHPLVCCHRPPLSLAPSPLLLPLPSLLRAPRRPETSISIPKQTQKAS